MRSQLPINHPILLPFGRLHTVLQGSPYINVFITCSSFMTLPKIPIHQTPMQPYLGHDSFRKQPATSKSSLYLCMLHLDDEQSRQLDKVCSTHFVSKLYLFGSAVGLRFNPERSDIDLAVEFSETLNPDDFADNFFSLTRALEQLFQRKVDLLSYRALKNPVMKEEIEKSKVSLYAA